jgi:serine/threonine protein phosphatase PrpC
LDATFQTQSGGNAWFFWYSVSDGELVSFIFIEDSHAAVLDLDEKPEHDTNAFLAVYDGHGGEPSSTLYLKVD